jgi:hypothetical protein
MRRNTLNKFAVLLFALVLFACKAQKPTVRYQKTRVNMMKPVVDTAVAMVPASTPVELPLAKPSVDSFKVTKLRAVRAKQISFDTFSAKAQVKFNNGDGVHDVTLKICVKKGQQIWISVTAVLGIEAARLLITPDSIKIMNRLDATYIKKPFSYVYQYTSDKINYTTLESLIVGNVIPELISDDAIVQPDNGGYFTISGNLQGLIYRLSMEPDLKLDTTDMQNPVAGQTLGVVDMEFIQAAGRTLPSKINISSMAGQKKIIASLHYTKVDFDQVLSYPFTVPARYTVIN